YRARDEWRTCGGAYKRCARGGKGDPRTIAQTYHVVLTLLTGKSRGRRMTEHARLPTKDRVPSRRAVRSRRMRKRKSRYFAFLSYSHRDEELADWLHRELEDYRVPPSLAGKLTENGVIPKRLTPVFRDEHELAAADDLGEEIEAALRASQYLIVLCSTDAADS